MTLGEIRRLYFIIKIFLTYGLDELIPRMRFTLLLRLWRRCIFWIPNQHKEASAGVRIRLAMEQLGRVWI
jgi:ubiquinone biosynthesis protein